MIKVTPRSQSARVARMSETTSGHEIGAAAGCRCAHAGYFAAVFR